MFKAILIGLRMMGALIAMKTVKVKTVKVKTFRHIKMFE